MEALAFVEILGRDGRVVSRHPVGEFPCRVGRAYDNHVILDDPYVAGHHLEFSQAGTGRYAVRDLGSRNGSFLVSTRRAVADVEIGPDETVRIGRTQVRIRPSDFPVPTELDARRRNWARHPATSALSLAGAAAAVSGAYYQSRFEVLEASQLLTVVFLAVLAVLVWSAGWAFAGRLVTGQWNYAAHTTVAGAAIIVSLAADELAGGLAFAFGARVIRDWDVLLLGAVFAYQCFRHLRLVSRAGRPRLAVVALAVAVVCFGGPTLLSWLRTQEKVGEMDYLTDIRPPVWRLAAGVPVERFIAKTGTLKERVDRRRAER